MHCLSFAASPLAAPQKPSKGLPFIQELALYRLKSRTGSQSKSRPGSQSKSRPGSQRKSRPGSQNKSRGGEAIELSKLQTPLSSSPTFQEDPFAQLTILKEGTLIKTSQSKGGKSAGFPRPRKFRLTTESLDYLHTFSHVRVFFFLQYKLPSHLCTP